jgi:hypothetical protein
MMRRVIGLVCLVGTLVFAATCKDKSSPTTPTSPATPNAPASLVAVVISGAAQMQPGESRQLSAIATFNDRSTRDVTNDAVWRVANTSLFTVAAGLVTATAAGESSISVMYQSRGATVYVLSLPSGTGILAGSVKEASFPIAGALIEVVGGPFAGRSTSSDSFGGYRLYGVVGDLQIRASGNGYLNQTLPVKVAPTTTPRRDDVLHFKLTQSSRVASLAGIYQAVLRPAGTCGASFNAIGARNYTATIDQAGSALSVVLSGAEFGAISPGVIGNRFDGRVRPDLAEFMIGTTGYYGGFYYYYYYTFGIVERLNSPTPAGPWGVVQSLYLSFYGTGAGPVTATTINMALNGKLGLYDAPTGFERSRKLVGSCNSREHQLLLTRQ